MGAATSKARRIIWCDTEGGIKAVPLWDATFIEDDGQSVTARRFCSVSLAHKKGKMQLRKSMAPNVFNDCLRKNTTCVISYCHDADQHTWTETNVAVLDIKLSTLVSSYLLQQENSIIAAWNMKAHDRHVLRRAVGDNVMKKLVLWDALLWFRAHFSLPKNTLSSNRSGTPRAVFQVPVYGAEHTSLADAAHLRQVVRRASFSLQHDATDLLLWKNASEHALNKTTRDIIDDDLDKRTILSVWTMVPKKVTQCNEPSGVQSLSIKTPVHKIETDT